MCYWLKGATLPIEHVTFFQPNDVETVINFEKQHFNAITKFHIAIVYHSLLRQSADYFIILGTQKELLLLRNGKIIDRNA